MRARVLSVLACLFIVLVNDIRAQQDPNTEKGFVPGKAYSFHGLDNVNLFNGNLNIKIPLGPSYPVSERLSYSFSLSYSGNNWNQSSAVASELYEIPGGTACSDPKPQQWTEPNRDSNAGMGWLFTFGQLGSRAIDEQGLSANYCVEPNVLKYDSTVTPPADWAPSDQAPSYLGPDGNVHNFYPTLHPDRTEQAEADVFYTNDGTYMRLQRVRMAYGAWRYLLEPGDGTIHSFDQGGTLNAIYDGAGNEVRFTKFDPEAGEPEPLPPDFFACGDSYETWIVDDGHRRHYVYFKVRTPSATPRRRPYTKTLCQMRLAAFDSDEGAVYQFFYTEREISRLNVSASEVPPDPNVVTNTVRVPLLKQIHLPDNSSYWAIYDIGRSTAMGGLMSTDPGTYIPNLLSSFSTPPDNCDLLADEPCNIGDFSGNLISLKVPTGGEHKYIYRPYRFPMTDLSDPAPPYEKSNFNPASAGVHSRRLTGDGRNDIWRYTPTRLSDGTHNNDFGYTTAEAPDSTTFAYFTFCRDSCGEPASPNEYGLPVSKHPASAGDPHGPNPLPGTDFWLSMRTRFMDGPTVKYRSTYVKYAQEKGANPRVQATTTVHEDGSRTTVVSSDWDGLGHYRTEETTGFGSNDKRVATTNYNHLRAPYQNYDEWVTGTYDASETIDYRNGVIRARQRSQYCFAPNGFLNRKRTLRGDTPSTKDLLVVFRGDGARANGNTVWEEYYGGDEFPLPGSFSGSCADDNLGTATTRIDHGYSHGVRNTSRYKGMTFFSLDLDIDASGFLHRSRDTAGVATETRYDSSGRVKEVLSGRARTVYTYNPSINGTRTNISVVQCPEDSGSCEANALTENRYHYDYFGRLTYQVTRLPGGNWASTWMKLDASDRVTETTVPIAAADSDYDSFPQGVKATRVTYDGVGRTRVTAAPDGTCTEFDYPTASQVIRKTSVGYCTDSRREVVTETRDFLGRLLKVEEGTETEATRASYDYRLGQLTNVEIARYDPIQKTTVGPKQVREFIYDNAGLMTEETHPESGRTVYPKYDGAGHLLQKQPPDCRYHQDFTYDKAGRLTDVKGRDELCNPRDLKTFVFATDGASGDKRLGKLKSAYRYNATSKDMIQVKETFTYGDIMGNLTEKETEVSVVGAANPIQRFLQSFSYNAIGQLEQATYPTCYGAAACGDAAANGVIYEYTRGVVTGVRALGGDAGTLASIEYHPNGMRKKVLHGNGVTDEIGSESGLPRPSSITFSGFAECERPSFADPQDAKVPYGQTVTLSAGAAVSGYVYQWYQVENNIETAISGATSAQFLSAPVTKILQYFVVVWTDCSGKTSALATLAPTLNAPKGLVASRYGASDIRVTWSASTGAQQYEIERRTSSSGFGHVGTTSSTTWTDSGCDAGQACVYRVLATIENVATSDPSNADLTTMITFGNLAADNSEVKAANLDELRDAVNAIRAASGRAALTWTQVLPSTIAPPARGGLLESDHVTALRTRLDEALTFLQLKTQAYTDPSLDGILVSKIHIDELRERTQ